MSVTTNPLAQCHTLEDVNPQTPLQEHQILQFIQYNPRQTLSQIHFSQNESFLRLILVFLSTSRQMTGSTPIRAWTVPTQPSPVRLLSVSLTLVLHIRVIMVLRSPKSSQQQQK